MLSTLFYFFLALFLLVTVHEYGHFIVARWCGVKVLRFSFGFGKVLARWHDKKGTEYAWSLFPLGGYVKMLDESEGDVLPEDQHLAFNRQSLRKRVAIVIAGPLFNFLFAFVALWLVAVIGMQSLAPMVDKVKPDSIAARAGIHAQEEVIALNDRPVRSWRDFQYALMPYIGSKDTVSLTLKSMKTGQQTQVLLPLAEWQLDNKKPDVLASLGLVPFIPTLPPVVAAVVPDTPASRAGLAVNDKIVSMNDQLVDDWLLLVDYVQTHPGKLLNLKIKREGQLRNLSLTIGSKIQDGKRHGFIGLQSKKPQWPEHWLRQEHEGPLAAIPVALSQTGQLTASTITLMGRLFIGQLGIKNLSGPVGIAKGAGESGQSGLVYYLSFLALVSISLGVLNLLPIPMLDGGHLLYYLLEGIRGKPLSDGFKTAGVYIGMVFFITIMVIAFVNDIGRLN